MLSINYDVSSFDLERYMKCMEVVGMYAQNKKDLVVFVTDSTFTCGPSEEVVPPETIKSIRECITGLNHDLEKGEETSDEEILSPAEKQMIRDVTTPHQNNAAPEVTSKGTGICKNCNQQFEKPRKNSEFCSPECRKEYFNHSGRSRKERVDDEEITCPVCGEKFVKKYSRQRCCSDDCQKLYTAWNIANKHKPITLEDFIEARDVRLAEKKKRSELTQRECANPNCKKMFQPSTDDQKYCCRACKDDAHEQRKAEKAGVVPEPETGLYKHICEVCEMPFSDNQPSSRFCKRCVDTFGYKECIGLAADTLAKKQIKPIQPGQRQYKVCPKCGSNFDTTDPNKFFCDKCTERALKQPKVEPLKPLKPEPLPPSD